jgi:hypothetical protein
VDTRAILAEPHTTLHSSHWPRSFAKEPPLTMPAGPQHKVTAYMQGQSSSAFNRRLYCVTEFARVRLGQEKLCTIASLTRHMLKDSRKVSMHIRLCRSERLAVYSGTQRLLAYRYPSCRSAAEQYDRRTSPSRQRTPPNRFSLRRDTIVHITFCCSEGTAV